MKGVFRYTYTGGPGKVYTAAEVQKIKMETLRRYEEKKGAVIAAAAADQLNVLINLSAYALVNMGFQKIPLEKFLGLVAEYTDDLNAGKFDYAGCLEKVKDVLGYAIEDPDVVERICEEYGLD